jgi:hypothetical protein
MTRTTALIVLSAAICLGGPATAREARSEPAAFSTAASAPIEVSSRHRYAHGRVVALARLPAQYTHAPIAHKVFGDPRWPYVNWRGHPDSLYVPGPLVTFVRYY